MKVVLVGVNSKFVHSNLAIRYLEAYTRDLRYSCELMEFSINDRPERVVEDILAEKPSILGFSCYIWNVEFINRLTTLIRLIKPEIEIFYGGPESSFDAEDFLSRNVGEYVIEGEGEETFREFIQGKIYEDEHKERVNFQQVKGLYIRKDNKITYGGKRQLMDMNKIVFPYTEQEDLNNKIVYYEGSRGCPFNCKYCLSSTTHGVRFLDMERVKRDLKFFIEKGVRLVKFVDRTFNCNKKFANEIWEFLVKEGRDCSFHFEISADLLSKESLKILACAKPNTIQFEIGVQSTNKQVLKNINREIDFSNIKEEVEELKKIKNVKQHLDLIAGLPGEDYKSFRNSFNEVYEIEPDELQLGFLKLLKGSSMREEAEKWGMVYSPYPPYEILKTKDISYEELIVLKKIEHVVDKYLNSGKFNNILQCFINSAYFETPFDFYYELAQFFENMGYFKRNISSSDYYKVFIEFNENMSIKNTELVKDIVKFDYLRFNKKKGLPTFLENKIDKTVERAIKDELIGERKIDNPNEVTIHKFNFNIESFIVEKLEIFQETYIAFSNSDDDYIFISKNKKNSC